MEQTNNTKDYLINLTNDYLGGQITFRQLDAKLKREGITIKSFARGRGQIKMHVNFEGTNQILTF